MPQPVDLQTEMARIAAAERIQQITDRMSLAAQQRVSESAQEERVRDENQVRHSNESEHKGIERDGRRRNPFSGRRQRRSKELDPEGSLSDGASEQKRMPEEGGQHLDLKV